jgi:hypothetical protein
MTLTEKDLKTKYAFWFKNLKDSCKAEKAILARFSEEPDELHVWTEQDIYEQSRKIIEAYEKAERSLYRGSAPNPGV